MAQEVKLYSLATLINLYINLGRVQFRKLFFEFVIEFECFRISSYSEVSFN